MLLAYCDGLCEPVNPGGTACYGFVIYRDGEKFAEDCGVVCSGEEATNNVAEYTAVIRALQWLLSNGRGEPAEIRTDSQLCVRQLKGDYAVRSPRVVPLYMEASRLAKKHGRVKFAWVPREKNKEVDALTRKAYAASLRADISPARLERARKLAPMVADNGDGTFTVPSQSGGSEYIVDLAAGACTCPDYQKRLAKCKHILAVELALAGRTA